MGWVVNVFVHLVIINEENKSDAEITKNTPYLACTFNDLHTNFLKIITVAY